MIPSQMLESPGGWLAGTGPHSDIVTSCRIRLARNLADYPFPAYANEKLAEARRVILEALEKSAYLKGSYQFDMRQFDHLDRRILLERHLISHEFMKQGTGVTLLDKSEMLSVMINEEDHLRLQSLQSGLQFTEAWRVLSLLERELDGLLKFAFDEDFGYLTACPTNLGTGMRVSAHLHLPALAWTREIQRIIAGVTKMGFAVRGFYGEGSEALGNFYQISNQITLGMSEEAILREVEKIVLSVIESERRARATLMETDPVRVEDQAHRAYGILTQARRLGSKEMLSMLSAVRLGIDLKILAGVNLRTLNELQIYLQPAHLQRRIGESLEKTERDELRARLVRERLSGLCDGNHGVKKSGPSVHEDRQEQ